MKNFHSTKISLRVSLMHGGRGGVASMHLLYSDHFCKSHSYRFTRIAHLKARLHRRSIMKEDTKKKLSDLYIEFIFVMFFRQAYHTRFVKYPFILFMRYTITILALVKKSHFMKSSHVLQSKSLLHSRCCKCLP